MITEWAHDAAVRTPLFASGLVPSLATIHRVIANIDLVVVFCQLDVGTAEGLVDSVPYAASATASFIMVSNSTGVSFPSRRCRRRR